ncbi:MAG: hypothetical protein J6O43_02310, partial [Clostridium sp.]|nr:hypothetical protein [Clostridium sp.]
MKTRRILRSMAALMIASAILSAGTACSVQAVKTETTQETAQASAEQSEASAERSEASLELKKLLEDDPELTALMEKSIQQAAAVNPDPDTNPVRSIDALYDLIDWNVKAMPWNVLTKAKYPSVFES